MNCRRIYVENFRNIESADLTFSPEINILQGDNAQGKTNMLEAVYLTALGRSFRQAGDNEMIEFGKDSCFISNTYCDSVREMNIKINLFAGKKQKAIEHNGLKVNRISEIVGAFKVIIFCPEHLSLIKEGPSLRRAFFDVALSQIRPVYINALQRYNAVLRERNTLLKNAIQSKENFDGTIDIWSEQLAKEAAFITVSRVKYLKMIQTYASECFRDMTSDREKPEFVYMSSSGLKEEECTDENLCRQRYSELYNGRHEREIAAGATLWGIHKDDIDISLNGSKARFYCSQGQQRSLALSMKIAEGEIIKRLCGGDYPVFLLDDVFSELDRSRREYLLSSIKNKQVILTSCELSNISDTAKIPNSELISVKTAALTPIKN